MGRMHAAPASTLSRIGGDTKPGQRRGPDDEGYNP